MLFSTASFGNDEAACLASVIAFESAPREPLESRIGIAQVVLNRVESPWYPNAICKVVSKGIGRPGCHFSWLCDGRENELRDPVGWGIAQSIARRVLSDASLRNPALNNATLFYSGETPPWWARSTRVTCPVHIGSFTFCEEQRR